MTQTIKPNDLVYIPSRTKCVCHVKCDKSNFTVDDGELIHRINSQGELYDFSLEQWITQPFAFLATPEMKEKLEQVYGKLEDIPVDKELKEFCEVIEKLLDADFDRIDNGFDFTEVDKFKNQLIQMFKERGSK